MIDEMLESSEKINDLKDNIFLEEKFLDGISTQMNKNIDLAKLSGSGTEEQKSAHESASKAIESLNVELTEMAEAINIISVTSQVISEDAKILIKKAEETLMSDGESII
jgi:hypothetical protein